MWRGDGFGFAKATVGRACVWDERSWVGSVADGIVDFATRALKVKTGQHLPYRDGALVLVDQNSSVWNLPTLVGSIFDLLLAY